MNELEEINHDFVQFNVQLKKLGTELCTIRNEINYSQSDMADWLKCDRRKISEIEAEECIDFELIFRYCQKLSIEIKIDFKIH
jgi:DNA-binding XRE family transcriptional regulator